MKKINISENAYYPGQDMAWTERTERTVLKKGSSFYHFSSQKIKAFFPKTTCFFTDQRGPEEHTYRITLLTNIFGLESITGEEVRIDLEENQNNVVIEYLGKKHLVDTGEKETVYSNYEGWKEKPVYTIQYV